MLGWKYVSHLYVAYSNFEGLDKIKKLTLKYANTQAFSGSQDNYMASKLYKFSSYKHAGLLKTWNPVQPTKLPPI